MITKPAYAFALGLLIVATALGGVLAAAHSVTDWCAHRHCLDGEVVAAGADGPQRQQPAGQPCTQDPACGGGAAHTLGTTLAGGIVALTSVVLLQPRPIGRARWPVAARLQGARLSGRLDHPPRLAT